MDEWCLIDGFLALGWRWIPRGEGGVFRGDCCYAMLPCLCCMYVLFLIPSWSCFSHYIIMHLSPGGFISFFRHFFGGGFFITFFNQCKSGYEVRVGYGYNCRGMGGIILCSGGGIVLRGW